MEFRLLGPLEVVVNGEPIELGAPKQRAVLALLLIHRNEVLSTDRIVDQLWTDNAEGGLNALRVHVANLRDVLEPNRKKRAPAEVLVTRSPGYALLAEPGSVDASQFARLCDDARRWVATNAQQAADTFDQALGLWRGEPLADFAYEEFAQSEIARLNEQRLVATEDRFDALIAVDRSAAVVAEIEVLVGRHPDRERLRGLHMLALYRSGRQAEALASYRALQTRLAEELGISPSPELQELELRILQHDPTLGTQVVPMVPAVGKASATASAVQHDRPVSNPANQARRTNLPSFRTSFIGRMDDLDEVSELVKNERLVTIAGTGGSGKTRLAVEVGRRLVDQAEAVWFVGLASVAASKSEMRFIAAEILSAMHRSQPPSDEATDQLIEVLGQRRVLLVLDNCEHVLDGAATLIDAVLRSCEGTTLLVTSREPLALTGEHVWRIGPLGMPEASADRQALSSSDAGRVFIDRAGLVDRKFEATETNAPAIAHICRTLEGIPLALELAAARVDAFSLVDLASLLEGTLSLPESGRRDAEERQASMESAIGWSYELLSDPERRLFRQLSAFAETFSLDAAARVSHEDESVGGGTVAAGLASLLRKSLIVRRSSRYRLLGPVRSYAAERLSESGEEQSTRLRHAGHFVDLVEQAERALINPAGAMWRDELDADRENLRAALDFLLESGHGEMAQRMAGGLTWYWYWTGAFADGSHYLALAVQASDTDSPALAKALYGAGVLADLLGSYDAGRKWLLRAIEVAESLQLMPLVARAQTALGVTIRDQGALSKAREVLGASEALARSLGDPDVSGLGITLRYLGKVNYLCGDVDRGREMLEEALDLFAEGSPGGKSWVLNELGDLEGRLGRIDSSIALLDEAVMLAREIGESRGVAWSLLNRARTALLAADYQKARSMVEEALELFPAKNDKRGLGWANLLVARHGIDEGDVSRAASAERSARQLLRNIGDQRGLAAADLIRGQLFDLAGDGQAAMRDLAASLASFRDCDDQWGVADALSVFSALAARNGDLHEAIRLSGSAALVRSRLLGVAATSLPRAHDVDAAVSRSGLSSESFAEVWSEGTQLSADGAQQLVDTLVLAATR